MKSPSKNKIRHPIHSNIITAALTASLYCSHDPTRQLVISSRAQCLLQMLSAASRLPIPSCFSCPARWKKRRSLEKKFTEQFSASARPAAPILPQKPCQQVLAARFFPAHLMPLFYLLICAGDYSSSPGLQHNPSRTSAPQQMLAPGAAAPRYSQHNSFWDHRQWGRRFMPRHLPGRLIN